MYGDKPSIVNNNDPFSNNELRSFNENNNNNNNIINNNHNYDCNNESQSDRSNDDEKKSDAEPNHLSLNKSKRKKFNRFKILNELGNI